MDPRCSFDYVGCLLQMLLKREAYTRESVSRQYAMPKVKGSHDQDLLAHKPSHSYRITQHQIAMRYLPCTVIADLLLSQWQSQTNPRHELPWKLYSREPRLFLNFTKIQMEFSNIPKFSKFLNFQISSK